MHVATRRSLLSRRAAGGTPWELITTPLIAYRPAGASDLANSYVNLANPGTYNASVGLGAPDWSAGTGWQFNGSNQSLTTNYDMPSDSSYTIIVKFSGITNTGVLLYNWGLTSRQIRLQPDNGSDAVVYALASTAVTKSPAMTDGILAIAGAKGFRNGTAEVSLQNSGGSDPGVLKIACARDNSLVLAGYIQDFGYYASVLSDETIADISDAMAAEWDSR